MNAVATSLKSVVLRSPICEVLLSRVGDEGLEIRPLKEEHNGRMALVRASELREALDVLYPDA